MMAQIGQEIRRLREEQELNQAQLAVLIGTGPAAIGRIENGRQNPNSLTLMKLAEALGVEVADFFPKEQAQLFPPSTEDMSEQQRSPLKAIAIAADVLACGAADPNLDPNKAFGLVVAAQAIEDQLTTFMGAPETSALSSQEKSALAQLMGQLEAIIEQYDRRVQVERDRVEMESRFRAVEREEARNTPAEAKDLIEAWKATTGL
jgi:transcriptional regulator with XRE-family HTH domain